MPDPTLGLLLAAATLLPRGHVTRSPYLTRAHDWPRRLARMSGDDRDYAYVLRIVRRRAANRRAKVSRRVNRGGR